LAIVYGYQLTTCTHTAAPFSSVLHTLVHLENPVTKKAYVGLGIVNYAGNELYAQPQPLPFSGFSMSGTGYPGDPDPANQGFLPENDAASVHPNVPPQPVPGSFYGECSAFHFLQGDVAADLPHTLFCIQLAFPAPSDHLLPGASPLLVGIGHPLMTCMGEPSLRGMGKTMALVRTRFLEELLR
jgi:hypothetical protein